MSIQNRIFHPAYSTIFLDMDGVVADFDKLVMDGLGRTFNHMLGPGQDDEMWAYLKSIPNLYFQLEPTPYAQDLWNLANMMCARVAFLTAIPRRTTMPSAQNDKIRWANKTFGQSVDVRFGPYSKDKVNHLNTYQVPSNPRVVAVDVLVDDREDNIKAWNDAGGIGILHKIDDYESTKTRLLMLQKPVFNLDFIELLQ